MAQSEVGNSYPSLSPEQISKKFTATLELAREETDEDLTENRFNEIVEGIEATDIAEWMGGGSWISALRVAGVPYETDETAESNLEAEEYQNSGKSLDMQNSQSDKSQDDWDSVSYVISSKYRVETLVELYDRPRTPSKIAEENELSTAHVSRALKELREKGMVELLVSDNQKKGRVYGITEKGKSIAPNVVEIA